MNVLRLAKLALSRKRPAVERFARETVAILEEPDPSARLERALFLEAVFRPKAVDDPDGRVLLAVLNDLMIADVNELKLRSKRGSDDRRDCEALLRSLRSNRADIGNSPEFDQQVRALKISLKETTRTGNAGP